MNFDCTGTFTINFTDGPPSVSTYFVVVDIGSETDSVVEGLAPGTIGVIATRSIGKRRQSPHRTRCSIPLVSNGVIQRCWSGFPASCHSSLGSSGVSLSYSSQGGMGQRSADKRSSSSEDMRDEKAGLRRNA